MTGTGVASCWWCKQGLSLLRDRPSKIWNGAFQQWTYLHNGCLSEMVEAALAQRQLLQTITASRQVTDKILSDLDDMGIGAEAPRLRVVR